MNVLTADGGSTKTEWRLTAPAAPPRYLHTQGINPFMLKEDEMVDILNKELLTVIDASSVGDIEFYGAGCRAEGIECVKRALRRLFPKAGSITVGSDLVGAARALFPSPHAEGVACILGTGSNSGLYCSGKLVENVSPLGFILGDEGSGAVLGRRLLGDVLKRQLSPEICKAFAATYPDLDADAVIARTYRAALPNRFLASFAPFLAQHRTDAGIHALLVNEFRRFFRRNVANYRRPDLPVGFVGSIAYHFEEELREAASLEGFRVSHVLKTPFGSN